MKAPKKKKRKIYCCPPLALPLPRMIDVPDVDGDHCVIRILRWRKIDQCRQRMSVGLDWQKWQCAYPLGGFAIPSAGFGMW